MFKQTLYVIALLVILAVVESLGAAVFENLKTLPGKVRNAASSSPVSAPDVQIPSIFPASSSADSVHPYPPDAMNDISVSSPLPNAVVRSPLQVAGSAVGNWYFEASFPVIITDGDGLILGETSARALGDWMTTGTVPFSATLDFGAPRTANGFLILKNDNPSGNPATVRSIEMPVRFR
ncbi:Gmad2 immunoglobulin-like domain-containing protein [Patescibacteria group bacterium]|nr:Gmad2 immunoglobulin-like domain-containing protein [Patescibacteria group bacterium]